MEEVKDIKELMLEDSAGMKVDSAGRVVIPMKKGDIATLSREVSEEVWRLMEREHALATLKESMNLESDVDLINNSTWLADTYNDTKIELMHKLEEFLIDVTLKEFDLELAYGGGELNE